MRHRIFIAINLPEDVKTALAGFQDKWSDLPARWTKPENLHITLAFIGDIEEDGISEIQQIIKNVIAPASPELASEGGRHGSFAISLNKISYSPYKKDKESPRMIWALGKKSADFDSLCDKLGKALVGLPKIHFKPEVRESIPHITLARIKEWEWRRIEPDERPEIEEFIDLNFQVNSIELMESVLKRSGPEYTILESCSLELET